MTDQQARSLLQEIASEPRITAEIIHSRRYGERGCVLKLFHKRLKRTLIIAEPDEWESVQEAWELVSEGCERERESAQGYRLAGGRLIQR